jgi:hypothetical protein
MQLDVADPGHVLMWIFGSILGMLWLLVSPGCQGLGLEPYTLWLLGHPSGS